MPIKFVIVLGYLYYGSIESMLTCLTKKYVLASGLVPMLLIRLMPASYKEMARAKGLHPWQLVDLPEEGLVTQVLADNLERHGIEQWEVVAIINVMDFMWPTYLELCHVFPLAQQFPSKEAVERSALKHNFRYHCKIRGVYPIRYVTLSLSDLDESAGLAAKIERIFGTDDVLLVVKPIIGGGSAGVSIVSSRNLAALNTSAQLAVTAARRYLGKNAECLSLEQNELIECDSHILIEEYLPGDEYSLEGVVNPQGKISHCLLQHKGPCDKRFRDFEYWVSSPNDTKCELVELAQSLVNLAEYKGGAFHIEARRNAEGRVYPIEFNPRAGGGSIPDLFQAIFGFDLRDEPFARFCDALVGTYHIVTRVIHAEESGTLVRYEGLKALDQEADIVFWKELCKPGSTVSSDRECYLIEFAILGRDLACARRRAEQLAKAIRPVIQLICQE